METKTLKQVLRKRSFPEFAQWWQMGNDFMRFMSKAIVSEWSNVTNASEKSVKLQENIHEYVALVYNRKADPALIDRFMDCSVTDVFYSGEFDALSYAFYRSAFETIAQTYVGDHKIHGVMRREFAIQVGKCFFSEIHDHLKLDLPSNLGTADDLHQLEANIDLVSQFLLENGYLRDLCEFSFNVNVNYSGEHIQQDPDEFLRNLMQNNKGFGLYFMGYPAILPSAVYLYQMFGEAQHHSSRTIEELFKQVGCKARETADFDPSDYPSEQVVELWEICQ